MSKDRIKRQFDGMTKGCDQEVVEKVCRGLVAENKRSELGYGLRVDLGPVEGEEGKVLSDRLGSWINGGFLGFLGIGIRGKIAYIDKIAQAGQKNGVK